MVTSPAGAQPGSQPQAEPNGGSLVQQMRDEADGSVSITREKATGKVGFVMAGRNGDLAPGRSGGAAAKADDFLSDYAPAFGAPKGQLVKQSVSKDQHGTTVTYVQEYKGLPVFGAMLRAHLDEQGDLVAVNGEAVPGIDLSVSPRLSAAEAGERAVAVVKADAPGEDGKADTTGVRAKSSELLVYREGLIRGEKGESILAYRVEVTNERNIRDIVFVSAETGKTVNRYSMVHDALERELYETSPAPDNLVWKEGDAFPGDLNEEQQNLVQATGESYWFFNNGFGRDSYDGAGATMKTVNNDPRISCPNANWNGVTTNYCNGVTSDDVVAHEWGHAYTEYTHGLIYQWQSGALNESYSDIWGETLDLINGRQDADEGDITSKRPAGLCSQYTRGEIGMTINSPADIAGPCDAEAASFGPVFDKTGVTTDVVVGQDAVEEGGTATDGCSPFSNAAQLSGKFVYADRGLCTFATKAANAQAAGATGLIVGDNVAGREPISMSGDADIYGLMIRQEDGTKIKSATGTVNVTIKDIDTDAKADSYRWLIGEDSSAFGGAIRDMWNPTCYGDPGSVSDAEYHCDTSDGGGVHSNSGVPNHGYALLVDGGDYNGVTVPAIGMTKAAHIYYRAMTEYQTPTSDFTDHANSLDASCTELVGADLNALSTAENDSTVSGEKITAEDCSAVSSMAEAVELRTEPTQCAFQPLLDPNAPAVCGEGTVKAEVFEEDFEGGLGDWTIESQAVYPGASTPEWEHDSTLPGGRTGSAAFGPAPDAGQCDTSAADISGVSTLTSPAIQIGAQKGRTSVRLSFDHYVATEAGYDGGNVKVSVNGGDYELVPADAFTFNPYNAVLEPAPGNTNPLAGQPGFTGTDGGELFGSWGESQVDLGKLQVRPGDTVSVRFDIGRDGCGGNDGWYVDDVAITVCEPAKGKPGKPGRPAREA
jgi:Zn-dependent metalloprotease